LQGRTSGIPNALQQRQDGLVALRAESLKHQHCLKQTGVEYAREDVERRCGVQANERVKRRMERQPWSNRVSSSKELSLREFSRM